MTNDQRVIDELRTPATDADDQMERLQARLAKDAERAGMLDISYRELDSPIGSLLLAATPEGLVKVALRGENHSDVLDELATKVSPRILRAPRRLQGVARQLDEYFAGRRHSFELDLDMRLVRGFRRTVLGHLLEIPYGQTESYAEVAAAVGNPKAVRAAGTACATNPLPLVIPCHRVVRSDGNIGNYGGGSDAKRLLLDLEGERRVTRARDK